MALFSWELAAPFSLPHTTAAKPSSTHAASGYLEDKEDIFRVDDNLLKVWGCSHRNAYYVTTILFSPFGWAGVIDAFPHSTDVEVTGQQQWELFRLHGHYRILI